MLPRMKSRPFGVLALVLAGGCSSSVPTVVLDATVPADAASADARTKDSAAPDASAPDVPAGPARQVFDLDTDTSDPAHFYDLPFPSDLRRATGGGPDYRGFPHPATVSLVRGALDVAQQRTGFPVVPVAWFRFDADLAPRALGDVIAATPREAVLLVDVDARSPERGHLVPTVAATLAEDGYTPAGTLAVAPVPGFVLHGGRSYAFVLTSALRDASNRAVLPSVNFAALRDGHVPNARLGAAAATAYAPLWDALATAGVDRASVIAATVFTTGDVVAETAQLGDRVVDRFDVTVDGLAHDPADDAATHPRYCVFHATATMPQFQFGSPPFNTDGLFRIGADGVPMTTTYPDLPAYDHVPLVITIPRAAMPAAGYPLVTLSHGSGGYSDEPVARGTWHPDTPATPCTGARQWPENGMPGCYTLGEGPAYHLAPRGFAVVGSALPVNPERLPGASGFAYLNLMNPAAMRDTFRQGLFEQRLLIEALGNLRIPAAAMAACTGASLPSGATDARFDLSRLVVMGQSMGGMYTHFIAATEPRVVGAIPTGAGGHWTRFIFQSQIIPGVSSLLGTLLQGRAQNFAHPVMGLLETLWEPVDPVAYVPRLSREPLPGKAPVSAYVPVGLGDSYFATTTYDEIALAYGHVEGGAAVWPTMQDALRLDGRDGLAPYPIRANLSRGIPAMQITSAVVQYRGDGIYDPHAIFTQLDAVKVQYGCFAQTLQRTGTAVIVDPAGRGADGTCD